MCSDRLLESQRATHSSGYDGMLIGEYAPLNPSVEKSLGQLPYLRDKGVSSLHVMWWPTDLRQGSVIEITFIVDQVDASTDISAIRHQDQTVNLTRKIMEGKRHHGGVTFDVLD